MFLYFVNFNKKKNKRNIASILPFTLLPFVVEAWRDARRTAWQTTVKVITTGVLAALVLGAAIKLKLMGGPQ